MMNVLFDIRRLFLHLSAEEGMLFTLNLTFRHQCMWFCDIRASLRPIVAQISNLHKCANKYGLGDISCQAVEILSSAIFVCSYCRFWISQLNLAYYILKGTCKYFRHHNKLWRLEKGSTDIIYFQCIYYQLKMSL